MLLFLVTKKAYSAPCSENIECNQFKKLECQTSAGKCNCPSTSIAGMCDCPRDFLNEYFWNGTECVETVTHGEACSGTSFMCKTVTEGTFCGVNGTSYSCQCPYWQYFNGFKCMDKSTNDENCTSNIVCKEYLGLSCSFNKCYCLNTHFWNGSICGKNYFIETSAF
jgi:hypothetical protein